MARVVVAVFVVVLVVVVVIMDREAGGGETVFAAGASFPIFEGVGSSLGDTAGTSLPRAAAGTLLFGNGKAGGSFLPALPFLGDRVEVMEFRTERGRRSLMLLKGVV